MLDRGWKYHPGLKHAIALASGILLARTSDVSCDVLLPGLVLSLFWLVLSSLDERFFLPAPVFLTVVLAGALLFRIHDERHLSFPDNLHLEGMELTGVVVSGPAELDGRIEWDVRPDSLLYRNSSVIPDGIVRVRLYDSSARSELLPGYGERISLKGTFRTASEPRYPGEPDYRAVMRTQDIAGTFLCYRWNDVFSFGRASQSWITEYRDAVRTYVRDYAGEHIGGREGAIVQALLIGDRQDIDRATREDFVRTGTSHVLAVSGLHVGVIALALFVLVSWLRIRWLRVLSFAVALTGYVLVTGARPSIVRAALMGVLFLVALNVGRIARPLNTLGLAGLLLLVCDPSVLFDPGFQLSFAAVAGILLLYSPVYRWCAGRFPLCSRNLFVQRCTQLLVLSTSAQLGTLPFSLYYFGYVSLIAPVVNICVVPLVSAGLGAGLLGVLFGMVPGPGEWFGGAAYLAIHPVLRIVEWSADFGNAGVSVGTVGWGVSFVLIAGTLYLAFSGTRGQALVRFSVLVFLGMLAFGLNERFDVLENSESGYVYLVPLSRGGGIAGAVHHGDVLQVYYSPVWSGDSSAAVRIGEQLGRRIGANVVSVFPLGSDTTGLGETQVCLMNDTGPEFLHRKVPVLLTNTGRRLPGIVRMEDVELLQIPLQRKLASAIVIDPASDWRIIEWR